MHFTLQLGFSSYRNYPAIAKAAEAAGWSYLSMPDSLFFPRVTESDYPYADTDAIRKYLEHSTIVDPIVAMSVMAAVTSSIKLYPGVLKVPVMRSQGNWRWEGPLGTPRGLVHWKRASSPVEAGTSGFL